MTDFFFNNIRLPSKEELSETALKMCQILENEDSLYRPLNVEGNAGGLLDFTSFSLPCVIIPDLHARPEFLKNILSYVIPTSREFLPYAEDISIFDALKKNLLRVVFLGDALHSEKVTIDRWKSAYEEYKEGVFDGSFIKEEMAYGLSLLMDLMRLKLLFPKNFHFLKGNHENIMNERECGNFPFRKYADEGNMVKAFITTYYGEQVLDQLSDFEKALPLLFVSETCFVSHAEPAYAFTREEVINSSLFPEAVVGLTWTDNGEAEKDSIAGSIEQILPGKNPVWFSGHRPVPENYKAKYKGTFYQIHNPLKQNVVFVSDKNSFNPETDIVGVDK